MYIVIIITQGFIISFEKLYACNLRLHPGIYHTPGEYNQSCNGKRLFQNGCSSQQCQGCHWGLTQSSCYGRVSLIFPWCYGWICLLIEFFFLFIFLFFLLLLFLLRLLLLMVLYIKPYLYGRTCKTLDWACSKLLTLTYFIVSMHACHNLWLSYQDTVFQLW